MFSSRFRRGGESSQVHADGKSKSKSEFKQKHGSKDKSSSAEKTKSKNKDKGKGNSKAESESDLDAEPEPGDSIEVEDLLYGLEELITQPEDDEDCVDIVAIHGLFGHIQDTWTCCNKAGDAINWLKHPGFLPYDIPKARVFAFGYDAQVFTRSTGDIDDFANLCLLSLEAYRTTEAQLRRPIIFLCHSMGGIVFKQIAITAHRWSEESPDMYNSIKGAVFFATPHHGSKQAFWLGIWTQLAKAASFGYFGNSAPADNLQVNSKALMAISDSFAPRRKKLNIISFYERDPMPGFRDLIVEKSSARLGDERSWPQNADHCTICKFSERKGRYHDVIAQIKKVVGKSLPPEAVAPPADQSLVTYELHSHHQYGSDVPRSAKMISFGAEDDQEASSSFSNSAGVGFIPFGTHPSHPGYVEYLEDNEYPSDS